MNTHRENMQSDSVQLRNRRFTPVKSLRIPNISLESEAIKREHTNHGSASAALLNCRSTPTCARKCFCERSTIPERFQAHGR
jgi:hypothetical protein